MNAKNDAWAVLTADIVGSQRVEDLRSRRDALLERLSKRHLEAGRILVRYTVTAWDEFQTVLARPSELPDVIWDLRLAFRPRLDLKIGVGLGSIDEVPSSQTPINRDSSGTAFLRAREAIESVDASSKYPRRTVICGEGGNLDRSLNLVYLLMDTVLSGLSDRQWETLAAYHLLGRLDAAAKRLGVVESTVSRSLQRGHYWQLLDSQGEIKTLIQDHLHHDEQNQ